MQVKSNGDEENNNKTQITNKNSGDIAISCYVRGIAVKIIDNIKDCKKCVDELLLRNPCVLGLDCDWKPSFTKKPCYRVSYLQLCDDQDCLLLKMLDIEKSGNFPINLTKLLKNSNILKVGVGIIEDSNKLLKDYGIDVYGCVDLRQLIYHKCSFVETRKKRITMCNSSLSKICNYVFGYPAFTKEKHMQTIDRVIYSARDAIYGYYTFLQCAFNAHNSKIDYSLISQNENEKPLPFGASYINNNITDIKKLCNGIIYTKQVKMEKDSKVNAKKAVKQAREIQQV